MKAKLVLDHFKQADESWGDFHAFRKWLEKCKVTLVPAASIINSPGEGAEGMGFEPMKRSPPCSISSQAPKCFNGFLSSMLTNHLAFYGPYSALKNSPRF